VGRWSRWREKRFQSRVNATRGFGNEMSCDWKNVSESGVSSMEHLATTQLV
jgi:hypothetical protein